jgi:hypothetical protein
MVKKDFEYKLSVMNSIHDEALKVLIEDHSSKKEKDEEKHKILEEEIKEMESSHAEEALTIKANRKK